MAKGKKVHRSPAQIARILGAWADSGLSLAAFSRERGISKSNLVRWAKLDEEQKKPAPKRRRGRPPKKTEPAPAAPSRAEVERIADEVVAGLVPEALVFRFVRVILRSGTRGMAREAFRMAMAQIEGLK